MMLRFVAGVALVFVSVAAGAERFAVPPEFWDRPRSGGGVLEQPSVRKAVQAYLVQPAARIVIHHAVSPEALMQAEELRTWLTALAIEEDRIVLRGGLKPSEPLNIEMAITR